jgi:hypothetical protein
MANVEPTNRLERSMDGSGQKLLVYFQDEQHIVQRLGAAVISCWEDLPQSVRSMLVEQAMKVLDGDETDEFDAQLKNFIRQHTGG